MAEGRPNPPGQGNYPPNSPTFETVRVPCPTANKAERCPDIAIPDGMQLWIEADAGNTPLGVVWIAPSPSKAGDPNHAKPLRPGLGMGLKIQNASAVYVLANTAGDSIILTVETN